MNNLDHYRLFRIFGYSRADVRALEPDEISDAVQAAQEALRSMQQSKSQPTKANGKQSKTR